MWLDEYEWQVYSGRTVANSTVSSRYEHINRVILESVPYTAIFLNEYLPIDARRRYDFLKGLYFKCKVVRFSHTSSREHLHCVWRIDSDDNESVMLQKNEEISSNLKSTFPKYFSRVMKLQFLEKFGRISKDKPSILREIYKNLTGDCSADSNQHESEIHERIKEVLDGEDDQLIWDL